MPINSGECFVVLPPHSETNSVIYGRNSLKTQNEIQEVIYFPPSESAEPRKSDGGVEIEGSPTQAVILTRACGVWGGETGANEKNLSIGITFSDGEGDSDCLRATDFVRLGLERASTAVEAVTILGSLNEKYATDDSKISLILCDPNEVWLLSLGGKLWAAEHITNGFRQIPLDGLAVTTKIDKSIENLGDKIKELGLWDGSCDLDFAKSFSSSPTTNDSWPETDPQSDGSFSLTKMFEVLRSTSNSKQALSSHVSTLISNGISCHWFTATPNPNESVFKPFIFAPGAKISPLTKLPDDENVTLLYKLHNQRNWDSVGELLQSLELTCVEEVKTFLAEHPTPNQELDELMKDCVEAEVKFYR